MRIAIASDHAAIDLKTSLHEYLIEQGHEVADLGPDTAERVDYPDFGYKLASVVAAAIRQREPRREAGQNPATRTFQALRILVNRELEEVALMLPRALARLAAGGRLAVISFHSLEDRLVKRVLQAAAAADTLPRDLPVRARDLPQPALRIIGGAHKPSAAETASNPRARSARLRVGERTAAHLDAGLLARRISTEHGPDAWRS